MNLAIVLLIATMQLCNVSSHPYFNIFRHNSPAQYYNNYANQMPYFSQFIPTYTDNDLFDDQVLSSYIATPDILPTLNVLAEVPYAISKKFTVVPMLVVSDNNMNIISNAEIMGVSKSKPVMMVKTEQDNLVSCTPAVRIVLEKPIVVYSLKTSIVFPIEIEVVHGGYSIPIQVGAVMAPVPQNTFVSTETPISIRVVYAVPTAPVRIDYVNFDGVGEDTIEVNGSPNGYLPPKNITVISFPEKEAEPSLQVDEEDEELVNRNPPLVLAPGGIVQSTQPHTSIEPFHNSKESPVLIQLREEAKKRI